MLPTFVINDFSAEANLELRLVPGNFAVIGTVSRKRAVDDHQAQFIEWTNRKD